jgi:AraC family transcriptional activator of tynA and feaB
MNDSMGAIQRWSTDDVPARMRFDYWANALGQALEPMSISGKNVRLFHAQTTATSLGPLSVIRNQGGPHRSSRVRGELKRSVERNYYLLVSRAGAWSLTHRGHRWLGCGDLVLVDSGYAQQIDVPGNFDIVNVKLPEHWLQAWVPDPDVLVGLSIPGTSSWGAPISAFIRQLIPEIVARAPLPHAVLADQVGALLAMVAGTMGR